MFVCFLTGILALSSITSTILINSPSVPSHIVEATDVPKNASQVGNETNTNGQDTPCFNDALTSSYLSFDYFRTNPNVLGHIENKTTKPWAVYKISYDTLWNEYSKKSDPEGTHRSFVPLVNESSFRKAICSSKFFDMNLDPLQILGKQHGLRITTDTQTHAIYWDPKTQNNTDLKRLLNGLLSYAKSFCITWGDC